MDQRVAVEDLFAQARRIGPEETEHSHVGRELDRGEHRPPTAGERIGDVGRVVEQPARLGRERAFHLSVPAPSREELVAPDQRVTDTQSVPDSTSPPGVTVAVWAKLFRCISGQIRSPSGSTA